MNQLISLFIIFQLSFINETNNTIETRFELPDGYERISTDSYGNFIRKLKLKEYGQKVKYYNGSFKGNNNIYCSVIDQKISNRDLQQCADAVMRIRGEYF